jgi:2-(1,2-epoxy-1,2-dihydrophenyl)acetyl-CoA isomerase
MPYETIEFDVHDSVAHVMLNRPDAANGVNLQLAQDLLAVTLAIKADPSVRAILITGAGPRFCAGGDVKMFAEASELPTRLREILTPFHAALTNLVRSDRPVVAAVQGSAAGAGMGFVGAADLVVAGESTKFLMAYTAVGLTPDGSSSWFLPRLVGLRRALELTFTNRVLSAPEALEWGLVNRVVPDDEVASAGEALAAQLAAGPTGSLGGAKRLLHGSLEATLETHLAREADEVSLAATRAESAEGIAAFVEKRAPNFRGD